MLVAFGIAGGRLDEGDEPLPDGEVGRRSGGPVREPDGRAGRVEGDEAVEERDDRPATDERDVDGGDRPLDGGRGRAFGRRRRPDVGGGREGQEEEEGGEEEDGSDRSS